jgi:predicted ATPase
MAKPAGEFVGRERELRELTSGVDDAIAGRGQLYLLAGEPGIGKTRLADEIARRAAGWGARALWGRCWEGGGAPPYWPWTQVLRACVTESPGDCGPCASRDPSLAMELHELVPAAAPEAMLDPEDARFRLFDAVSNVLRTCAARTPLVVVLDDLQWADESSLLLLAFLARDLRGARLLLLGAYRDVEARRSPAVGRRITELACDASPHCTQSRRQPRAAAWRKSAVTQSFGFGWASAATSRPCTAFACGACLANGSATAPS